MIDERDTNPYKVYIPYTDTAPCNTTIVIVNHNTLSLLQECVESVLKFYPDAWIILMDNGSEDGSVGYMTAMTYEYRDIFTISFGRNIGHGPAIHMGMMMSVTDYVLTLDSDCVLLKEGLMEGMSRNLAADASLYATGWLRYVNINGVEGKDQPIKYVHPMCGMYRRSMYLRLPPFNYHGAPVIQNMIGAMQDTTIHVAQFDVFAYIRHRVAGTRRMYAGRWYATAPDEKPGKWLESATYPI